jgi:hypothetical protein
VITVAQGGLIAGLAVPLVSLAWAFLCWRKMRLSGPLWGGLLYSIAPLLLYLVAASLLLSVFKGVYGDWDAARVAASVALAKGHGVYGGLNHGAVLSTMYPPGWLIAYLPTAIAATPTGAMLIGYALAAMFSLTPAVLALHRTGSAPAMRLIAFALLVFSLTRVESLWWASFFPHADAPAMGLALLAIVALQPRSPKQRRPWIPLLVSAAAAVGAVWCKQVMVPLLPALWLWILCTAGWRRSVAFIFWIAFASTVALLVSIAIFSPADLWLNLVVIPGHCPWVGQFPFNLMRALVGWMPAAMPAILTLALGAGFVASSTPRAEFRAWLSGSLWLPAALVAVALIPTALMGFVKEGGAANSLAPPYYMLFSAAILLLAEADALLARVRFSALHPWRSAWLAVLLPICSVWWLATMQELRYGIPSPARNLSQRAYDFLRANPSSHVYFPAYPLAHLLAQDELCHFSHALADRVQLAKVPISQEQLAEFTPDDTRIIAWTERQYSSEHGRGAPFFPGFRVRCRVSALPDFRCFQRALDPTPDRVD